LRRGRYRVEMLISRALLVGRDMRAINGAVYNRKMLTEVKKRFENLDIWVLGTTLSSLCDVRPYGHSDMI